MCSSCWWRSWNWSWSWRGQFFMSSTLLSIILLAQVGPLQSDERTEATDGGGGGGDSHDDYSSQTLEPLPYFDRNVTLLANMTVQMGTDVSLSCRVNQLGDKVVSWMKKDEKGNLNLLTYGLITYNTNPRQKPQFQKPNDWQLLISSVNKSDSGAYQCQIPTHPPKIQNIFLNVIAPIVEIVDDGEKPLKDKIFKTGSTLELRCIVGQVGPGIAQHVNWFHDGRLLNNDTLRGGISVKSWVRKDFGLSKLSKLYVANVNKSDSGLYVCSLGRYGNATVYVSIHTYGELPASLQHGVASHSIPVSHIIVSFGCLTFLAANLRIV